MTKKLDIPFIIQEVSDMLRHVREDELLEFDYLISSNCNDLSKAQKDWAEKNLDYRISLVDTRRKVLYLFDADLFFLLSKVEDFVFNNRLSKQNVAIEVHKDPTSKRWIAEISFDKKEKTHAA